jgi:hypothetical protein
VTARSPRQLSFWLLQSALLVAVVLAVRYLLERATGHPYSLWGCLALLPLAVAGWHLANRMRPAGAAQPPPRQPLALTPSRRRPFARLETLDTRLRADPRRGHHYERTIRPALTAVAADRLRRHHGIDIAADPSRARAVAGEELWELIDEPWRAAPPSAEQLGRALSAAEQL